MDINKIVKYKKFEGVKTYYASKSPEKKHSKQSQEELILMLPPYRTSRALRGADDNEYFARKKEDLAVTSALPSTAEGSKQCETVSAGVVSAIDTVTELETKSLLAERKGIHATIEPEEAANAKRTSGFVVEHFATIKGSRLEHGEAGNLDGSAEGSVADVFNHIGFSQGSAI